MGKIVLKLGLFMLALTCFSMNAQKRKKKKANEDTQAWRYDISCEGIAKQGSKLVKVWSYSKSPEVAMGQAMKNAVHGIIFKGYSGGVNGCTPFNALAKKANSEEENKTFFTNFFADGGEYRKYVTAATDGNIGPGDRLKISKKEYKIGVVVNVAISQLRKKLETEGIIRSLNSGF